MTDAGSVDEAEGDAMDEHGVFHGVARGAVDVADDGLLLVQQLVEERTLADVGLSNNGHGDAFFECVTHLERTCECRHPIINLTGKSDKFRTVGELQFFMVAEVQFQFQ